MAGSAGSKKPFNLSRWSIAHPSIARFLFGLIVVAGVIGLANMGQKEDPDFTFRTMVIQTAWPGASLVDMQEQVVNKIERKLQEVPHLDYIKSYVRAGSAVTTINIKGDTTAAEVKDAFYQVRKKTSDISSSLPSGLMGPYFNDEFGDTFITMHAVWGEGFTFAELKAFAIKARDILLSVPGVEKATILGDQSQRIYIDLSSKMLAERALTVNDIATALAGQNNVDAAGSIQTAERSVRVNVQGDVLSVKDVENLRLKAGSEVLRLGDIASVTEAYEEPFQRKFRFDGHDSVQIGVVMAPGFKVTDVGHSVEEAYATFTKTLPLGVMVSQISNQPEVVSEAVGEFGQALVEALVIVLVVSLLSIGWRPGIVIAITIPLVLAATFAVMYQFGIELQRISLGALIIALGLLVDDAMIVVELMERKLEEGLEKLDAASFAYTSTAFPMLTGTLITVAGFIPVGFANSTAGEYVRSLFYVVAVTLVISWLVAVYFTPWLGYMILKQRAHAGQHHDAFDGRFYRKLWQAVAWSVRHRILVLCVTLVAFAGGIASFQFIPKSFFPQSSRPEILVDMWLPEGTAIEEVERQAKRLEAKLVGDPDQMFFATYIGEGIPRFFLPLDQQLPNPNFAQIMVMSKGGEARERLIQRLRTVLHDEFPSVRSKVDRLFLGPPVGWAVQMRVIGPDSDKVRDIADQVKQRFKADGRITTIHDDWLEPVTEMQLVIDQDRARALGVTSQMVRQAVNAAVSGAAIGTFRDGEETIAVVVRETSKERNLLSAVASLYIPTNLGTNVPLSQIARVQPVLVQSIEWRRDRLPTITVRGIVPDGMEGSDVGTKLYSEMGDLIAALPPGYKIEQQGGAEESAISQQSIAAKAPIMLLVILCLLMAQLQHFGKAMLVLATGPLGIIGAAMALLMTQAPFGFVAILGVIALLGIIIRNSIILVDQIDQDIVQGMKREDAIIGAAVRRFRPIVLTAMTAVLALVPISRGLFWGPMAYAMMGGILVATVLTIFVLPACYFLFFGKEPKQEQGQSGANDSKKEPLAIAAE